eukprot:scpid61124/ scgid30119/ Tripartite motif-containing protein 45
MPLACASCGCDNKRTKLVSCLHAVCLACLDQHIQEAGSIKCPSCQSSTPLAAGCSPVLSLPDSYATESQNVETPVSCDECDDGEAAAATCLDCDRRFCGLHAQAHSRSKSSRGHTVVTLAESTDAAPVAAASAAAPVDSLPARQPQHRCALHSSKFLSHFCVECNKLLCQWCIDTGTQQQPRSEQQHKHDPVPIADAAEKMRALVRDNVSACTSSTPGSLETTLEKIRSTIHTLDDQVETASEQAQTFFLALTNAVKARETNVLNELDNLRSPKRVLLESQLARLQGGESQIRSVTNIIDACNDSVDFLRMFKWLNAALASADQVVKDAAEPCNAACIIFAGTATGDVLSSIGKAGACADLATGRVRHSDNTTTGSDVVISVETDQLPSDATLSEEQLNKIDVQIDVTAPNGDTVRCKPLQLSSSGHLMVKYRPVQTGEHTVTANIARLHLQSSLNISQARTTFDAKDSDKDSDEDPEKDSDNDSDNDSDKNAG